ncbi:MAG: 30S ribosomal protein S9 [Candidatus Altarchaeaceae archaeon]
MNVVRSKRKRAIARAHIREGNGKIRVNSFLLENYFTNEILREYVKEPLLLAEEFLNLNKINIYVNVKGGGISGQADAVRTAIAKAFYAYTNNDLLKKKFIDYDRVLLVDDVRRTEPHKPSQSSKGPRHKKQKSYR